MKNQKKRLDFFKIIIETVINLGLKIIRLYFWVSIMIGKLVAVSKNFPTSLA